MTSLTAAWGKGALVKPSTLAIFLQHQWARGVSEKSVVGPLLEGENNEE